MTSTSLDRTVKRRGNSIRAELLDKISDALWARTACRPPEFSRSQLERMLFENDEDQQIMAAAWKRYPKQIRLPSVINWRISVPTGSFVAEWTVQCMASDILAPAMDARKVYRDRDPETFDRVANWVDSLKIRILEAVIGMDVLTKVLKQCDTSTQLARLWPEILYLDRSGLIEPLTGRERQPDVLLDPKTDKWFQTAKTWVAEGVVSGSPSISAVTRIPVDGMELQFYVSSLHATLDLNTRRILQMI